MSVTLRDYRDEDLPLVAEAVRASAPELVPWCPWAHADYSTEEAATWLRQAREWRAAGTAYEFAMIDSVGGYAGACGLNQISLANRVANLGYWVRSSLTGQGVATSAVRQLIDWAMANTDLNRLEILIAAGNTRSQRVAEKVGARRDGFLAKRFMLGGAPADAVLYSIVR